MGAHFESPGIVRCFSVEPCEWDIVDGPCGVTDPMDFAEAAGAKAVVSFHSHDFCNGWHVSKDEDDEGTKKE